MNKLKVVIMVLLVGMLAAAFAEDYKSRVKLDTCMFNELRGKTIEVAYSTDSQTILCGDCDDVEKLAYMFGSQRWACLERLDGFTGLVSADQKLLGIINKHHQVLSKECIIGKTKTGHYYIIIPN